MISQPKHTIPSLEALYSICDFTFLRSPEFYQGKRVNDPILKEKKEFYKFMQQSITSLIPYSVCVRPERVRDAKKYLDKNNHSEIIISTIIGYPYPNLNTTEELTEKAKRAISYGAREIEILLDYQSILKNDYKKIEKDISKIHNTTNSNKSLLKVIIPSFLDTKDLKKTTQICYTEGADFICTYMGANKNISYNDVRYMKQFFKEHVKTMPRGIKIAQVDLLNVDHLLSAARGYYSSELDPKRVRLGILHN